MSALELDAQITADGRPVVTHDRRFSPVTCRDTAPATAGDRSFPHAGKLVKDLTLAQLTTLDCGTCHPADPATDPIADSQLAVHGDPQNGSVLAAGYRHYTTKEVVQRLTNYPDRLRDVLAARGYPLPRRFDLTDR